VCHVAAGDVEEEDEQGAEMQRALERARRVALQGREVRISALLLLACKGMGGCCMNCTSHHTSFVGI